MEYVFVRVYVPWPMCNFQPRERLIDSPQRACIATHHR